MENEFTLRVARQDVFNILALLRKLPLEQVETLYPSLLSQVEKQEEDARQRVIDEAIRAREAQERA